MKLRIQNGHVVDPASARDEVIDVWIDGSDVIGLGRRPSGFTPSRTIDASGMLVCPGFVDIGARLREPGFEHKGTIASELRAAAIGGFTTVCCMPDTDPVIDTPAVVELIHQRARDVRGAQVLCIGALTRGLEGQVLAEMSALKSIGCVAVSNASLAVTDTAVMANALSYAATLGLTVLLQSEDYWLARHGVMHEGAHGTRLGLAGIPSAAETIGLARDLALVENSGARAHFRTLSTTQAAALMRAARRRGLPISCDVGLMHLSFDDTAISNFDPTHHVRPPLRSARDRAGLIRALARGQIDAVTAHHEPHDADAKATPFAASDPGISGFDTFVPQLMTLTRDNRLSLKRAIEACTAAPANILGLDRGTIARGKPADLIIIDPQREWLLDATSMASAGKNNPLLGDRLRGRVVTTIVGGRVVHELAN